VGDVDHRHRRQYTDADPFLVALFDLAREGEVFQDGFEFDLVGAANAEGLRDFALIDLGFGLADEGEDFVPARDG
jgi:hypothetical protein